MKERLLLIVIMMLIGRLASEISEYERDVIEPERVERYVQLPAVPVEPQRVPFRVDWPIDPVDYLSLSSPFGERDPETIGGYGDDHHDGVDMYGTWRARIRAGADAYVACVFRAPDGYYRGHPVLGGLVILELEHNDETYYLVHGHLSSVDVMEGAYIAVDTLLGRQGNTGRSDGAHLHFGINRGGTLNVATGEITGGEWLNPLKHILEPKERSCR